MSWFRAPQRRTVLLYLLAVVAYVAMLRFGPLNETTHPERVFATVLAGSFTLVMLFLSRRIAFSLLVAAWLFMLIWVSSLLKDTYLTTPLVAPDLIYFVNRDTLDVVLRYPLLVTAAVLGMLLVPLALFGIWRIDTPHLFARLRPWPRRGLALLGLLVSGSALALSLTPDGPFRDVYSKGMWLAMIDKSYLSDFFVSIYATQIVPVRVPDGTDRSVVWNEQVARTGDPARKPDIVAVLEESTFDPRMLAVCKLPQCRRKMFDPDKLTRAHGFLQVHTWGGGTWTSEFALMTGIAHTLFGSAGLYAPFNLAPRVEYSLPRMLKENGYRTVVIYPTSGSFINARNAYAFYGMDRQVDNSETKLGWDSPDSEVFKVFDRVYAEERAAHPDEPLFVLVLTLRQHGPHMTPLKDLPPPYNKPLFPKQLDDWLNLTLGNYLYRLEQSDLAMAALEKRLFAEPRPLVLLHFGDHQPSFDGAINNLQKIVPKGITDPTKVTYYVLKSNFTPREKFDYPVLDIIYLGGLLLDTADLRRNDYYEANTLLRERCRGRYFDCATPKLLDSYHAYIFDTLHALKD